MRTELMLEADVGRTQRHVKVLAGLFLSFGAFWLLLALWFLSAGGLFDYDPLAFAFIFWFCVLAASQIIAGWALLRKMRWARPLALVLAGLALIIVPIGTVFGAYAFWVLLPPNGNTR